MLAIIFIVIASILLIEGKRPLTSTVVFSKGEGNYYCHKIPYLYRTNAGSLIALAEGRGKDGRASCDDFSGTDLVFKRSLDNGKTWNSLGVLFTNSSETESNVIGNAAPVQDSTTGRIWMPFCRNNEEVFITYSDDDGITWAEPTLQPHLTTPEWKWIGLGPPGGIQLSSGRLLIPAYHTNKWKGDGCVSYGYTIYSDDHGTTWSIGSSSFGAPYLANECQAVELKNGSVLINSRTLTNKRIQTLSHDGGITFDNPVVIEDLHQPLEGCEGSLVRDPIGETLYFSDPYSTSVVRMNMTIFASIDDGLHWTPFHTVDQGSVAYSSLQVNHHSRELELLYERSDTPAIVFEPDEIVYWKTSIAKN